MLLTVAGLVIVLAATIYVAWPLLAGADSEPIAATTPAESEHLPEKDKELALLAIKEAEFDHRTGKLSDEDYAALRAQLEERAIAAMVEIDDANALRSVPAAPASVATAPGAHGAQASTAPQRPEASGFCPACGQRFLRGATFCGGCGRKLPSTKERGRRRA